MKNLNAIIDTYSNPAQDGIDAAQKEYLAGAELIQEKAFLEKTCDQFKAFVLDSCADHCGHDEDRLEFLKNSLEVFIDLKNEGME